MVHQPTTVSDEMSTLTNGPALPDHLRDCLRLSWYISHWCNYQCEYCGVPVYSRRDKSAGPQVHAFDYQPPEHWLEAFDKFQEREISLIISGGEPFLDRNNFVPLLEGLTARKRFVTTVFTNASWTPEPYAHLDKSALIVFASFHSSQTTLEAFVTRLRRIQGAGFTNIKAHVVIAPENAALAETAITRFREEGWLPTATVMQAAGAYLDRPPLTPEVVEVLERHALPYQAYFAVTRPVTRGKHCYHPALTYRIEPNGDITSECLDNRGNLFSGPVPERPVGAVSCPWDTCFGCPDMIESIVEPPVPSPSTNLYLGKEAASSRQTSFRIYYGKQMLQDLVEYHRAQELHPNLFRATLASWTDSYTGENAYERFVRLAAETDADEQLFDIPLGMVRHAVPKIPVFGYIDRHTGTDMLDARYGDRILLSGWAASTRPDVPIREVRLRVADTPLAVFRQFYPRPEVVATFGREDFRMSGWRGYFFLPRSLRQGEYPLVASAVDASGYEADLPELKLRITR